MSLFLGLDLSTQSLKAILIDTEQRAIVHEDSLSFDDDLPSYGTELGILPGMAPGVAETPPAMWRDALERLLERLARDADLSALRALSVGGQQHGLVALNAGGELARPTAKLWNDVSTTAEAAELERSLGGKKGVLATLGNTVRPGYTSPKILHLKRHEPDLYSATAVFLLPHNYLNFLLTGKARMEYGDASGTALWDPVRRQWATEVIDVIGPELRGKLPEVLPPDRAIGRTDSDLAVRCGLPLDCTVDAGSGDNMYGAVGTGNVRPGLLTVSLGSSGTAYTVMEQPWVDVEGEIALFCDSTGAWLPLVCTSNLAAPYESVLRTFGLDYGAGDSLCERRQPGEEGRLILPWFQGERTPDLPAGRPVFFGFGPDDFTAENLCRPLMDGVLMNLAEGCRRLPVRVAELRLTGGLARSPVWRQALADILDLPVVPLASEGVALGAAIHAAWIWHRQEGREVSLENLCSDFVRPAEDDRALPQPEMVARYTLLARCFRALSGGVRGLPDAEDPFEVVSLLSQAG